MEAPKGFSGKKKKQLLQAKRAKKICHSKAESDEDSATAKNSDNSSIVLRGPGRAQVSNRLRTVFDLETKEEIETRKRLSYEPLNTLLRSQPWKINESLTGDFIDIPKRPPCTGHETKEVQELHELESFRAWQENLRKYPPERLNYFEQNLEVWRQLWRVVERSDIVMLVMDGRFPLFHFPPALYHYVVVEMKRPLLLVLNKSDSVDPFVLELWKEWLSKTYPHIQKRKIKRGRKDYRAAKGVNELLDAIRAFKIYKNGQLVNIPPFVIRSVSVSAEAHESHATSSDSSQSSDDGDTDGDDAESEGDEQAAQGDDLPSSNMPTVSDEATPSKRAPFVVVGTVGHPNVGKSSLINGLVGRKVVSTSRTPGHTKHFQTIFLSPEVQLCDCPGLVFPALDRPKALQILCGLFPLAQVREPYSAVRYLAERIPLERIYGLRLSDGDTSWSPYSICEALAVKRGYLLAKSGRPDAHRAGREILIDALDGRVVISWPPPDSQAKIEEYYRKKLVSDADDLKISAAPHHADSSQTVQVDRIAQERQKKEKKEIRRKQILDPADLPRKSKQQAPPSEVLVVEQKSGPRKKDPKAEKAREYQERLEARGQRSKNKGDQED